MASERSGQTVAEHILIWNISYCLAMSGKLPAQLSHLPNKSALYSNVNAILYYIIGEPFQMNTGRCTESLQ